MESVPTREQYREALAITVYDDPWLERQRRARLFIGRLGNPFYRLENALANATYWVHNLLLTPPLFVQRIQGFFVRSQVPTPGLEIGDTIVPSGGREGEE
jgi:hypothetical protein